MKLIHSFWSKPSLTQENISGGRKDGGWLRFKYQLYSYTLSCLKARDTFGYIDLVTDRAGKEMFIDAMQLPYRSVDVLLDDVNNYPPEFWAVGKLYTYGIQREPFLHIDNDIFLWSKFSPALLASALVAQNAELNLPYYNEVLDTCDKLGIQLPKFVQGIDRKQVFSSNAGVIGGNDHVFFSKFVRESLDFIDINREKIGSARNGSLFNVLFEQLFYHHHAQAEGLKIQYVINKINPDAKEMVRFHITPSRNEYIHVYGNSLKRDPLVVDKVELTLKTEFPDYYYRVTALLKEFQI